MHTKDKLAEALRAVGLDVMADEAATGYYHDFLSPLDTPELQLISDLMAVALINPNKDAILELRERVMQGDFDASKEESDAWANSEEGQRAFKMLGGKKH